MASRVTRVFHKIIAFHLTAKVPLDPRQKAFMPVDGCADNIFLMDSITREGGPAAEKTGVPGLLRHCQGFRSCFTRFDCQGTEEVGCTIAAGALYSNDVRQHIDRPKSRRPKKRPNSMRSRHTSTRSHVCHPVQPCNG